MTIYNPTSIIYQAINSVNGKSYIGYTSQKGLYKRKTEHIKATNSKKSKEYNNKFHNALRKYGKENFEWYILYESWDNEYCLKVIEDLLINDYNTIKFGYNTVSGGGCPPSASGRTGPKHPLFGKTPYNKGIKTGPNNKSNRTIYTFYNNITKEIFIGNSYNFYNKYDLDRSAISKLTSNKYKSWKNWIILNS